MDCYNVKVINYLQGTQVRVYSDLIGKKNIIDDYVIEQEPEYIEKKENKLELRNNIISEQITIDEYIEDKEKEEKDRVKALERSISSSKNRTINNIYDIARSNHWEYFLTLTFNPDKVNSFDYDEVTNKLSKWLNNFKNRYAPDLKYILVPELHKSGRYHFHGLLANIGNATLVDSGVRENGNIIYNLGNYKFGFSTITIINNLERTCSYIGKYITKELCATSFGKKRYWASKNLDKPQVNTYVMTREEIDNMIDSFSNRISYTKSIECINFELKTTYYELENEV